jgi:hypothetical protein
MRFTVLMPCAVLVLFGCQGENTKNSVNIYISNVSTPYIEGIGYEIFEDPSTDPTRFPEGSGLVKGDRVWEMKSVESLTIKCDILGDLRRLFHSQDPYVKSEEFIIMTWHVHAVVFFDNCSYGISVNFTKKLIKFEKLMPVENHVGLLKSDLSSNGLVVTSIKYLSRNHPCIYNVLDKHFKYAIVEVDDRKYQFSR